MNKLHNRKRSVIESMHRFSGAAVRGVFPVALAALLAAPPAVTGMGRPGAGNTPRIDPRAWEELDIVPMPKEIRLTDDDLALRPDRVALVIGADACRQSEIGAEWINRRLAAVGDAAPLPVTAGTDLPDAGTALIIGTAEDNPLIAAAVKEGLLDVGPDNPGERGYEIRRSADGRRIYLAGADEIGALYACVTFGELLERRGETVTWRAAEVRDAPDLVWLEVGSTYAIGGNGLPELFDLFRHIRTATAPAPHHVEAYLQAVRTHHDHILRRKFSLMKYYGYRIMGAPFEPTEATEIIRAGIDYGRERGIEAILYAEQPFAGRRNLYPDIAESRVCPASRGPHAYDRTWIRCWSLDELYEETARNLARFVEASGITHVGFHDTDTGWYTNPAQWEERCEVCRERWGDDFTAATIHKHRIYYDAIKERTPEARVHFTFYPYGAPILIPERAADMFAGRFGDTPAARAQGREHSARYHTHWRRLHEAFPIEDVTFAIREAPEDAVQAFRAVTPGRGLFTWLALMSHAWRPLFSEAAVWSGTFVDNPRDIIGVVAYLDGFVPLEGWAVREYSWNRNTPGARPWDRGTLEWDGPQRMDGAQWKHAEPRGEIYERILPRLARNYFGRDAAPHITAALSQNVDLQQIFNRQRRRYTWLTDSGRMQWQAERAERGSRAMDALWERIAQDPEDLGLDAFTLRRVINLRERLRMGMWAARARREEMHARELATERDRSGAEQAVQRGLEAVRHGRDDAERLLVERPSDPVLEAPDMNPWVGAWRRDMADRADFDFIEERLLGLQADIPALSALGAIPEPIMEELAERRTISAYRAEPPPRKEIPLAGAWLAAQPIETFMILDNEGIPARAQTRARLVYDEERFHVAVECWTPGGADIDDKDLAEIFLSPSPEGDYVHFFLDAGGGLQQQYNTVTEEEGLRRVTADNDWQCPGLEYAVHREPGRWTAFLSVPADAFGAIPGEPGWSVNIGRVCTLHGGEVEISSIQRAGAGSFHDRNRFPPLSWSEAPYPPLEAVLAAPGFNVATMTLPDSIASVATFRLEIETDRILHDVRLEVEAYDADGRLQQRQSLDSIERITYRWSSPGEYVVEYRDVHERGGLRLRLVSPEGTDEQWLRFGGWEGTPQAGSIYGPGLGERRGLRAPVYLSDRVRLNGKEHKLLHAPEGTVEFWFAPRMDWIPDGGGAAPAGTHTFLHYGPHRTTHPAHVNNSPLSVQYTLPSGRLYARLLNRRFAGWLVHARAFPWSAGQWRHIALVWETDASEEDRLRLYVDGRRLSGRPGTQNRDRLPESVTALLDTSIPFPIQIGALNNGRNGMNGVLEQLRISRTARYREDFEPAPKPRAMDYETALLLPLDGSLAGEGLTRDGHPFHTAALPGTAW